MRFPEDPNLDAMAIAIGERLRSYRGAQGLSQKEVARATGISRYQLCKYEAGLQVPSLPNVVVLAQYWGVIVDTLMLGAVDETQFGDRQLHTRVLKIDKMGPGQRRWLRDLLDEFINNGGNAVTVREEVSAELSAPPSSV